MNRLLRVNLVGLLLVVAGLGIERLALAQVTPDEDVVLARKLGMYFTLPSGARSSEKRVNGSDVLHVVASDDPPGWTITFQRLKARELGETYSTRVDAYLKGLAEQDAESVVFSRKPVRIGLHDGKPGATYPAELLYMRSPFPEGGAGISGLLVVQTAADSFLYGTLFALEDRFNNGGEEELAELYASLRLLPENQRVFNDAERIETGAQVLGLLTPEVLREVAEDPRVEFYRLFERSKDGTEREIGWQRLITRLAPRSAVAIDASAQTENKTDDDGLLVTIEAEVVSEFPTRRLTVDILRKHWISLDRSEEQWSVVRTPRRIIETGTSRTETKVGSPSAETGVRTAPQPRAHISIVESNGTSTELDVPRPPNPFLSQTELFVIGRLLRGAAIEGFACDWYALDRSPTRGNGVRKRSDTLRNLGDEKLFELQTRGPTGSFVQRFDTSGERIERLISIGDSGEAVVVLERYDPQRLVELYRSKNLPVH